MPALKIAVQLNSLRMPLRRGLQAAAKLGVAAVELEARGEIRPQELTDTGLRQIRKMLEDANLRVAAVGYHTRRGYNVEEELDRRVAGTKAAMKFAYDVGAAVVVNQIGRVPAESSGREWQLLVEVLHDLLGAARAACGKAPGIACILGTGSNTCLYDGNDVIDNVTNLGYLLGDEGKGGDRGDPDAAPPCLARHRDPLYPVTRPRA